MQAGVNKELESGLSGIGVALPQVDPAGISAFGGGPKGWLADFIQAFEG